MKWWREARFGMFIHWGVYSVPAGTYHGQADRRHRRVDHEQRRRSPWPSTAQYAKQFNPVKYNADEWVQLAKDAGMKYIVITSKHHDGFAMFDSKATDWNIVDATPYGKDLLKALAEACQKHGLKLGFYYSQAQDWNNPGGAGLRRALGQGPGRRHGRVHPQGRRAAGPRDPHQLRPDRRALVGHAHGHDQGARRHAAARCSSSSRASSTTTASAAATRATPKRPSSSSRPPAIPGRDWETCMTMNDTWGYKSYDHNWKSTEDADPQPGGHRLQGRQLPAERRADLRRADPGAVGRAAARRSASG